MEIMLKLYSESKNLNAFNYDENGKLKPEPERKDFIDRSIDKGKDFLEYLDLNEKDFWQIVDKWRPKHLWHKYNNKWKFKENIK